MVGGDEKGAKCAGGDHGEGERRQRQIMYIIIDVWEGGGVRGREWRRLVVVVRQMTAVCKKCSSVCEGGWKGAVISLGLNCQGWGWGWGGWVGVVVN